MEAQEQNKQYQYTNIFFVELLADLGGVETFLCELAKKMKDYNLVLFYPEDGRINKRQLERIGQYIKTKKHITGEKIKCKKAFFNYHSRYIDDVEADEYIQIVHADFSQLPQLHPKTDPHFTKYYGVSKNVCKVFTEMTGKQCDLCYNPISIEPPKRVLNLISATRLTAEKGGKRMKILAEALTKANIPFMWTIFTNSTEKIIDNPNVIYLKAREDIRDYIANADYTVQLSDTEGYSYTILESLCLGTPIITTPLPVLEEMGANEENSIQIDFDMKNIPIDKIYNSNFDFKYTPHKDIWDQLIILEPSTYYEEKQYEYKVKALRAYQDPHLKDKKLDRIPDIGEEWWISKDRLDMLLGENPYNTTFVEVIDKRKIK